MPKVLYDQKGIAPDVRRYFYCPGCKCSHAVNETWTFNGDYEKPTLNPSLLSKGQIRCHMFIRDGKIQFLNDSEHELAGKTVDMEPWEFGD